MEPIKNVADEIKEGLANGTLPTRAGFECRFCFNSGFREVTDPQGSGYKGVVRCDFCEYWNFRRQNNG